MRGARRKRLRASRSRPLSFASIGAVLAIVTSACTSTGTGDRWSLHFDTQVWGGALEQQVTQPDRVYLEGALLVSVPIAFAIDGDAHRGETNSVHKNVQLLADIGPPLLGATALGVGAFSWIGGDQGRRFEIAAESLLATEVTSEILKTATQRDRPDGNGTDSFPSGHTAFSFAAATLVVQDLDEVVDPGWRWLNYLAYAPAVAVGVERIAQNRHWVSDVVAGAFLGVFLTNLIHDAHTSEHAEPGRPLIFEKPSKLSWRVHTGSWEGRPEIGLELAF
jgi:membrane-associated phospholipid phosphatase